MSIQPTLACAGCGTAAGHPLEIRSRHCSAPVSSEAEGCKACRPGRRNRLWNELLELAPVCSFLLFAIGGLIVWMEGGTWVSLLRSLVWSLPWTGLVFLLSASVSRASLCSRGRLSRYPA
ncbi:hypothetical protein J31TS4_09700 [Paenibacillus sp. J31TS4]|uniref:hypothetical protein n=1 Tax=Paenibacillus sp. J31TS4 TaxID=2807195 RepID=UPI001B005AAD|nr:hypothetical protein [Paenibacillus sp. J31TS4]GIP37690.1 hypothetical protein J31TS4_09700 [Paenibacillus sp. J31TS4]